MSVGYIYVMSNPKMPGLLKIGFTCGTVERRRRELSGATGVPDEFMIDYSHLTEDAEEIESKVHAELAGYRVADRREFFDIELSAVIAAIERHAREPSVRFERPGAVDGGAALNVRLCRRCGTRYDRSDPKTLCPGCGF